MKTAITRRLARGLARGMAQQRGGTTIEMAFVLPTFFLLLFGLFSFSIVLFGYSNATFASRAGARYASLHSSTSLAPDSTAIVQSIVMPYLFAATSGAVTVTTTWSPANTVGSSVQVSVKIVYPIQVPLLALQQITVSSSAQRTVIR